MNVADWIILAIAAVAAYRGWRLGLARQLLELGGGFIGLIGGLALGPKVADAFTEKPGAQALVISLIVVFVVLSAGQTIGYLVGHKIGTMAAQARLGGVDKSVGIAFGVLITMVSYWLLGSALAGVPAKAVSKALRGSKILRMMNDAAVPPDVLAQIRHYLDTSGFPQVFSGLPRPLSPPVKLPSNEEARRAVEAAIDSTVRIVVQACDTTSLGSGWIAAEDTVVTNAHVVAGGSSVSVEDEAGGHVGTVVVFAPGPDIAVIHVEGLSGPPLELETDPLDRGAPGATLGYPGDKGGRLVTHRAAVQAHFDAVGRDIYGKRKVTRDVYELRAAIRQGDSGGPFVLPSGEVAGVVFAAATNDKDTGYALTGAEVANEIESGSQSEKAVSTGDCTR
ncbi:MAG TPA: MarP family serine protease [Actinomycetota bacterium]|nr:MarP family serine protease [Actinomycetota bacterium]